MIFSKFFHLSREGSKTIMQAGIWLAVFNLAALLPVVLLAMVSESMMTKHFAGDGGNIPLLPYAAALLVILTVMFLTYKVAYHKEYLTSGQEEYKLRMELADKLRVNVDRRSCLFSGCAISAMSPVSLWMMCRRCLMSSPRVQRSSSAAF